MSWLVGRLPLGIDLQSVYLNITCREALRYLNQTSTHRRSCQREASVEQKRRSEPRRPCKRPRARRALVKTAVAGCRGAGEHPALITEDSRLESTREPRDPDRRQAAGYLHLRQRSVDRASPLQRSCDTPISFIPQAGRQHVVVSHQPKPILSCRYAPVRFAMRKYARKKTIDGVDHHDP